MTIAQIRQDLGGASLNLYYLQRDLEAFTKLWLQEYKAGGLQVKLRMLREVSTKYSLFSRAISDLI